MGNNEHNGYKKNSIKFQNEFLSSRTVNPLNNISIKHSSSSQNEQNNEESIGEYDINSNEGNNSFNNEEEKKTDILNSHTADAIMNEQNILKDIIKDENNEIEKEKKIENDKNNDGMSNIPMMSTEKNLNSKRINFNKNNEEKDKKEEKNILKNKNNDEEKISNVKSINENVQINNEVKSDEDSINEEDIIEKENSGIKNNNFEDNYNTINNEEIREPLIKSRKMIFEKEEDNILKKVNPNMEKSLNINNNNKIDKEINKNINTSNEINKNDKDEEDGFDINLKINNTNKFKKSFTNNINIEIEANQINEDENQISEIRKRRSYTFSNIILNPKIPKKVFLFNNPNIFDSILIILNNIIYINDYFAKTESKIEDYIKKCEQKKEQCLLGILYYINKYLWAKRPEDYKIKNEMRIMYKSYMDNFVKEYCENSNPDIYLYDSNNIESIINFIFSKINSEITNENQDFVIPEFTTPDQLFNNFMNNYIKTNKSVISVNFAGFYLKEETCLNCKEKHNNNFTPKREISDFNYILFDLRKYRELYSINQRYTTNSFNSNLNIYDILKLENQNSKDFFCEVCNNNSKKNIQKYFFSLPKVLTIILHNNEGNFEIYDEINLSNYFHVNNKYNLISILCKYENNTYITYCINHRDSNWYYYTSDEIVVHKVRYLDINAIPYVLVYQNAGDMVFEYKKIKRKNGYIFKFQNGLQQLTLYFEPKETVKDAKKEIQRIYSMLINPVLLFNSKILKNEEKLSDINFDVYNKFILVIAPKNF